MRNKELLLELSYNCNLKCIHCSSVGIPCETKLNLNDVKTILKNHLPLSRHTNLGEIETVRISGGEPLLNEDMHEYTNWFRSMGIKVILQTNGTVEIPSKVLSSIDEVWVSLYGRQPIHDFITGGKNYYKTINSINNVKIHVNTIIQSPVFNQLQMKSLCEEMKEIDLPLRLFSLLKHGRCKEVMPIQEQRGLAKELKRAYDKTDVTCSLDETKCNYENKLVLKPDGTIINCASHKHNKKLCKA